MTPLQAILLKLFCIWVPFTILLLGPEDAVLKYIWKHRFNPKARLRTWHYETLAVMALVAAVVMFSGDDPAEWVGFAALVLAHGRNSVMFRFSEAQQRATALDPHHVQCWAWGTRYFLLAECFWAAYFVLHRSWAALAGVAIFVGYGQWRKWYGRKQPVKPIPQDPRIAALTEEVRKLRAEAEGLRAVLEDTQCALAFARKDLAEARKEMCPSRSCHCDACVTHRRAAVDLGYCAAKGPEYPCRNFVQTTDINIVACADCGKPTPRRR